MKSITFYVRVIGLIATLYCLWLGFNYDVEGNYLILIAGMLGVVLLTVMDFLDWRKKNNNK